MAQNKTMTPKDRTAQNSPAKVKYLAQKYNALMHEKLHIQPYERIIFVTCCLLALQNKAFAGAYASANDTPALADDIIAALKSVLEEKGLPADKALRFCDRAELIKSCQALLELNPGEESSLIYFLTGLEHEIMPMIDDPANVEDALAVFYNEFLNHTAGRAGTELGIVLTPGHLCDFMCEAANLTDKDVVIDLCCGTGSLLAAAQNHLTAKARNEEQIRRIKNEQFYGVELQSNLFAVAAANLILRGAEHVNIFNDDCFKFEAPGGVAFTAGLINPPYSQKTAPELEYVKRMLDLLAPGGVGVAVVPVSCAIGTKFKAQRRELFGHHSLKAVFSMPDDIFYPVKTNVCVMVWQAHVPHDSLIPTYFGYCKDDGFVKKKNLGRIDARHQWPRIKREWIDLYQKKAAVPGKSVLKCITCNDEWLCEAYMETDYSALTQADFEKTVRDFLAYSVKSGSLP